jgi:hypothetical protein
MSNVHDASLHLPNTIPKTALEVEESKMTPDEEITCLV